MKKNNLPSVFTTHFDRDEFITPFDKLIDKFFNQSFPQLSKEVGFDAFQNSAYPKCDIVDFTDRIEITAEIPGMSKEQIQIDVGGDTISIKGEKVASVDKEGGIYLRRELKKSSFKRTFAADTKIFDLNSISAKFVDGVLELIIPKITSVEQTKKTIQIL